MVRAENQGVEQMKAKSVKPIKPSMDYLTGKHDGYEQGKKDADGIKATLLIERDKKARKQTYEEVLKELVRRVTDINEDYDSMEDLQLWLEQKIKELSK
jgi:hypothetical protein